ncbi:universal stress protein [Aquabacterium sp. OR-4]|uniref:universal stress protein n=1 Tax=Aquabacterium sp. OR-4 TaxID=2978127 RepID=UPI0021B24AF0|nr:universal stress protein [Aquabacterium sp. OR-4]MDT7835610.1 universal stress protein [Aquabacterium sp. OR-4]
MKILLPVDGSPDALAAVAHALALVRQGLAAEMVLVNVQEPPSLYEVVTAHDAQVLEAVRTAAGADLLAPAEALLDAAGVSWESEVAGGQPAPLLLELLENYGCQAVVMGARGVTDAQAGGPGSVALALLDHSPVPVTVVRAVAAEPAEPVDDGVAAEGD